VRPGPAADHSPPSSAAVIEECIYTSTHPLGHTGPVTGSFYLYLLHGAESFLRSLLVFSWSRNAPHFMGPEGSLPHSQEPAPRPYPEPARSSSYTPIMYNAVRHNLPVSNIYCLVVLYEMNSSTISPSAP